MKIKKVLAIIIFCICQIIFFSCNKKSIVTETTEQKENIIETTIETNIVTSKTNEIKKVEKVSIDKKTGFLSVNYGKYENEDVEWLIIDKNDDYALLLSKKILDCKNYNDMQKEITWDKSTLRKWLNNDFVDKTFSKDEQSKFGNMNSFGFGLIKGDYVSLLNIGMCEKYFGIEDSKKQNIKLSAKATEYAKKMGVECDTHKNTDFYECGSFFLTDNGNSLDKATWVGQYGHIYIDGQPVKLNTGDGIRPVICLKTEVFSNGVIDSINSNIFHEVNNQINEIETDINMIEMNEQDNKNYVYSNVSKYEFQSENAPCSEKDVIDLNLWEYGKTPAEWVYVMPNIQIVSNISPNKSKKFGYKQKASSGPKGCYMIAFTNCDITKGEDYDGRFYSLEDYTKVPIDEIRFANKFEDLVYSDYKVLDLLKKRYEMIDISKGIYMAGDVYVNIVYIDELDDIIAKGK